jgi:hypothetical protein
MSVAGTGDFQGMSFFHHSLYYHSIHISDLLLLAAEYHHEKRNFCATQFTHEPAALSGQHQILVKEQSVEIVSHLSTDVSIPLAVQPTSSGKSVDGLDFFTNLSGLHVL